MTKILWDGEQDFPSKILDFKKYLLSFLQSGNVDISNISFHYDLEEDEFFDKKIQEYYQLWRSKHE